MIIILRLRHPVTVTFSTFPCCILLGFVLYKDMHFHHVTMGFSPGVLQNWPKGGEKKSATLRPCVGREFSRNDLRLVGKPRLSKWCLTQVFSRFACFWKNAKNKKFERNMWKSNCFWKKRKKRDLPWHLVMAIFLRDKPFDIWSLGVVNVRPFTTYFAPGLSSKDWPADFLGIFSESLPFWNRRNTQKKHGLGQAQHCKQAELTKFCSSNLRR